MSTVNSRKVTEFFKPVSAQVHNLNNLIEQQKLRVQLEEEEARKKALAEKRKQQILADNARRKRDASGASINNVRTEEEIIRDLIAEVTEVDHLDVVPFHHHHLTAQSKRKKTGRPPG